MKRQSGFSSKSVVNSRCASLHSSLECSAWFLLGVKVLSRSSRLQVSSFQGGMAIGLVFSVFSTSLSARHCMHVLAFFVRLFLIWCCVSSDLVLMGWLFPMRDSLSASMFSL